MTHWKKQDFVWKYDNFVIFRSIWYVFEFFVLRIYFVLYLGISQLTIYRPPPISFDPVFMDDAQCAETNEKSIGFRIKNATQCNLSFPQSKVATGSLCMDLKKVKRWAQTIVTVRRVWKIQNGDTISHQTNNEVIHFMFYNPHIKHSETP